VATRTEAITVSHKDLTSCDIGTIYQLDMPPSRPPPPPLLPSSIPPLIDLDAPISSPPSLASPSSNTPHPTPSTRPTSYRPSPRSIARFEDQPRTPPPPPRHHLDESDIDRFASLFMPATPPGTPTQTTHEQAKIKPCQHRRTHTESSSSDSDFGPFVSVPPSQDPLASSGSATPTMASTTQAPVTSLVVGPTKTGNTSLDYFGQFTTSARAASERSRKGVLDELLEHQDDPMYFLAMQAQVDHPLSEQSSHAPTVTDLLNEGAELRAQTLSPPLPPSTSSALAPTSATHTPRQRSPVPFQSSPPLHAPDMPDFHHESIAEALASELDISPQSHTSTHTHHTHLRPSSQHHTHHTHTSKHTYLNPYENPTDVPPVRKKLSVSSLTGLPRTGAPLPPHLSATATPPSLSSPSASEVSLPLAIGQEQEDDKPQGHHGGQEKGKEPAHQPTWPPAHGTLSRLSSTWVSAFLSGTPRHSRSTTLPSSTPSTPGITSSSLPSLSSNFLHSSDSSGMPSSSAFSPSSLITHGSPFASTLFIPPTGAPGFTGDRNWDKGFSNTLLRERERGTVDVVGLGGEFTSDGGRVGYADGLGIANGADAVPRAGAGAVSKNTNTKSAGDGPAGGTKMKVKRKGVSLCGRREGTAEVLTEELANEVCCSGTELTICAGWTVLTPIFFFSRRRSGRTSPRSCVSPGRGRFSTLSTNMASH